MTLGQKLHQCAMAPYSLHFGVPFNSIETMTLDRAIDVLRRVRDGETTNARQEARGILTQIDEK